MVVQQSVSVFLALVKGFGEAVSNLAFDALFRAVASRRETRF